VPTSDLLSVHLSGLPLVPTSDLLSVHQSGLPSVQRLPSCSSIQAWDRHLEALSDWEDSCRQVADQTLNLLSERWSDLQSE
jgi:hypothetical protein